jgi:putative ABC transport system permease protein
VLISILGTLVGIGLGVGLCYAITRVLGTSGAAQFALPVGSLVTIAVLAGLLGTLASVLPARRAARMAVLEAIATE